MRYSQKFFDERRAITERSANRIMGLVWRFYQPESVLDMGCATGIWLAECMTRGTKKITGVDGNWVPESVLDFPTEYFLEYNLIRGMPEDIAKHEMALCIEVAEHLPANMGEKLIKFLTERADIVVFSAAVPGQGGTGHVNEQLQSYWFTRFSNYGFFCFDRIRPSIWNDEDVNVIYKQNMLVYVRSGTSAERAFQYEEQPASQIATSYELDRVHPDLFFRRSSQNRSGLLRRLKRQIKRALKRG